MDPNCSTESVKNYLKLQNLIGKTAIEFFRRRFLNLWDHLYKHTHGEFENNNKLFLKDVGHPLKGIVRNGNLTSWDLPLLIKVINHFQSNNPVKGMVYLDSGKLQELKKLRDNIAHHPSIDLDTAIFQKWWDKGVQILKGFGVPSSEIQKCEDINLFAEETTPGEMDTGANKAVDLKLQGNEFFRSGDFSKALEMYTEAINITGLPSHVVGILYSNRSLCHIQMGNFVEAKYDAKCTVTVRPSWFKGYARLGMIFALAEDYNKSLKYYKLASVMQPGDEHVQEAFESCKFKTIQRSWKQHLDPSAQYFTTEDEEEFHRNKGNQWDPELEKAIDEKRLALRDGVMLCREGHRYFNGSHGYRQDDVKAVEFFSEAASNGDSEGLYNLARLIQEGRGTQRNAFKALKMFQRAAEMPSFETKSSGLRIRSIGVPAAQHQLGLFYHYGLILPKNIQSAILWYTRALENGCHYAPNNLGCIYTTAEYSVYDPRLGYLYYELASFMGNVTAMENIFYHNIHHGNFNDAYLWHQYASHYGSTRLPLLPSQVHFSAVEFRSNLKSKLENTPEFRDLMKLFDNDFSIGAYLEANFPKPKVLTRNKTILKHREGFKKARQKNEGESTTAEPKLKDRPLLELTGLKSINIKQIMSTEADEKIFDGLILKVRVIEDAIVGAFPSIGLVVEDEDGGFIRVFIYDYPRTDDTQMEIGYGCSFSIINPHLRLVLDGHKAIRVNDPGNFLIRHPEERVVERCRYCGKTEGVFNQCRKCQRVKYCSRNCLRKDQELKHELVYVKKL